MLLCFYFFLHTLTFVKPSDIHVMGLTMCKTYPGLSKDQLEICRHFPDVTQSALDGLQLGVTECQHQFQWHRWNCSSLNTKNRNPHTSVILQRGYRETAFAYAILAAGVAHSVAKSCSTGKLLACECDPDSYRQKGKHFKKRIKPQKDRIQVADTKKKPWSRWKWGGCSHNLDFGLEFSESFLDLREKAGDIQSRINLHNNEAGRLAVLTNVQKRCKCHGYSGSCGMKTCWKVATDFRRVGQHLKDKYYGALPVDGSNAGRGALLLEPKRRRRKRPKQIRKHYRKRKISEDALDLFYYQRSPNFCEKDPSVDFAGTVGRQCNKTSYASDGCGSMCCGRGYDHIRENRTETKCQFHWCCNVTCLNVTIDDWKTICK